MNRREFMTLLAGVVAGSSASGFVAWPLAARAQQPSGLVGFPNKTMRIIVPFTPGGSNDVVAREIATGLQDRLNQTAVVENKPGGGGTIAYQFVAKSPPDGHTHADRAGLVHHGAASVAQSGLQSGHRIRARSILVADVPFVHGGAGEPAGAVGEGVHRARARRRRTN